MKTSLVQILVFLCLFISTKQTYAQYTGGESSGHANLRLSNVVCAVININPFNGGLADGHSSLRLANLVCAVINANPFNGGQADGHSLDSSLACPGIALPIELLSFAGECKQNSINLKWTTASETNNDFFTIERSLDGLNFEIIGKLKGGGNSNKVLNYSFMTLPGTFYYRLKQTDFNGVFKYSKFIYVNCQTHESLSIKVYPNPGTNELTLEKVTDKDVINFEIINVLGIMVYKGSLTTKTVLNTTDFATGVYLIKLENGKIYKWIKSE